MVEPQCSNLNAHLAESFPVSIEKGEVHAGVDDAAREVTGTLSRLVTAA